MMTDVRCELGPEPVLEGAQAQEPAWCILEGFEAKSSDDMAESKIQHEESMRRVDPWWGSLAPAARLRMTLVAVCFDQGLMSRTGQRPTGFIIACPAT